MIKSQSGFSKSWKNFFYVKQKIVYEKQKNPILTNNDELVEQIRLDKNKKEQIIDYAVDRNHKYKGYGFMLDRDLLEKKMKYFTSIVHKKNIPSINIFKKLKDCKKFWYTKISCSCFQIQIY